MDATSGILREPFPAAKIRQREGAGRKTFDYVNAGDVMEKLIQATDNTYMWEIQEATFYPERKVERTSRDRGTYEKVLPAFWMVWGRLTIPGKGHRDGIGTQVEENEDSFKGAETDALKRAAVKFGVALDLYMKDDEGTRDYGEEFANRCETMGYTGSKTALCRMLTGKDKPTIHDYGTTLNMGAAAWNEAIDTLLAREKEGAK